MLTYNNKLNVLKSDSVIVNYLNHKLLVLLVIFGFSILGTSNNVMAGNSVRVKVSNYNFGLFPRPDQEFYYVAMGGVLVESSSPTFYKYVCCQPGEAPWEISPFYLTLENDVPYTCTVIPPSNFGYCCGDYDTRYLQIEGVDSCSNIKFIINGSTSTGVGNIGFSPHGPATTVSIIAHTDKILFKWDYPEDGVQALTADGTSVVSGTATDGSEDLTWSFVGDDLGCKLLQANGPVVMVQAGTNTGTVSIEATDAYGECTMQQLKLVDCSSSGCSACQGGGDLSVNNGCVEMKLNLGWSMEGNTADYLHIKEYTPSSTIATPSLLHYDFQHTDVQVYSNSLGIYQVKSPRMLVNIVTNSSCKYSIQLYNLTNIVGGANRGFYQLTNSPYRTVTVENPGGNINEVVFTDSNDGSTYDFTWQANGWLLTSGGGLRNELKTTINTNGVSVVTTTIYTDLASPVQNKIEVWRGISGNSQRLIQEIYGSGRSAKTNNYSYYSSGFLQQVVRWDGSWSYYLYDSYNRPTYIYSGFLNQGVTTNSALCSLTVNDYSTSQVLGSGDNGLNFFTTPRCTVQYLKGQEIGRKYFIGLFGQRRDIQCINPGAAWSDSGNLVTTYNLFTNGFRANEPQQIIHPDGTAELYQYTDAPGQVNTKIVWSGHLDGSGANVDDGTETISVISPTGLLQSKTIMDIKTSIVMLRELYGYDSLVSSTSKCNTLLI